MDVGTQGVRLIQLSHARGRCDVAHASFAALPDPIADPLEQWQCVKQRLPEMLRAGGFQGRHAVIAVPHRAVRIKSFRLPFMPEAELEEAVRYETLERFQASDNELELRHYNAGHIAGEQGEQLELIVLGARAEVLRAQIEALSSAGLEALAIDFAPAAAVRSFARFLRRAEDAHQTYAFLDLGFDGARVVITRGTEIAFIKTFDMGTGRFLASIRKSLSLPPDQALELYNAACGAPAGETDEEPDAEERRAVVMDAIAGDVDQLGKELGLCLRYFAVTFREATPEGVTCIGGGARATPVLERLSQTVHVPVRLGHPLRGIGTDQVFTGADRRFGQPEWATALGLALRTAQASDRVPAVGEAVAA